VSTSNLIHQHAGLPIGLPIVLFGRVLDSDGRGVPNTLIEIWQTNAAGRYTDDVDPAFSPLDPNFTGAGRCITDSTGAYRFLTIRPAPYPGIRGGLYRPAHIHVSVFGPDLSSRLITQCYFPGDPLVKTDWIATSIPGPRGLSRLTCVFRGEAMDPNGLDSWISYEWDIVLRGATATPVETP
jgi:protocatechuate 3,4-dioxygenase beta subunit